MNRGNCRVDGFLKPDDFAPIVTILEEGRQRVSGLLARLAGWVERVNAVAAKDEIERLGSCARRSRPFARRRLGAADGAAAGLGISAARSVAAKISIACGKGDGFAAVRSSVRVSLFSL